MPELKPLNLGAVVRVTETPKPEPSAPAPAAVEAAQEKPKKEEQKLTTKFSTPTAVANPGAKPSTDAAVNAGPSFKDWVAQDMAYKSSQPLPVSDGGKGVSN
jgi:hypothetical protein